MDESIMSLEIPSGYSKVIGGLVAQMRLTKHVIGLRVSNLTVSELDYIANGYDYTIGTLLKHMVLVEKLYQSVVFLQRDLNEQERQEWKGVLPGEFIIEKNIGNPVEYYLSIWDKVRESTESYLLDCTDEWLYQYPEGDLRSYGNHYYCLYHVLEDQLSHYGQIKTLMSLQTNANPISEKIIHDKINQIALDISSDNFSHPSLLSGEMSNAIFYATLYRTTNETVYKEHCERIIDRVIDFVGETPPSSEFCHGYTGIAWGINYMAGLGVVEVDMEDFFEEIDEHIYDGSKDALKKGFYDYLFGGLGGAVYALDRLPDKLAASHLAEVVNLLDETKEVDQYGIKWIDGFSEKEPGYESKKLYTLGLAHGIPGIISILLKIYDTGINSVLCRQLLEGAVQWMLFHTNKTANSFSIYSNCVNDATVNPDSSRLGWCYGDLSIAWVLWNAGKILGREEWTTAAVGIMEHSVGRRDPLLNENLDGMFCHGTAGIAYLFRKFYSITQDRKYLDEANYWLEKTLSLSIHKDGFGGYKRFNNQQGIWVPERGIIDGTIGIGLVLMSFLNERSDWDRCMLL
ncbi:MAG TPA: lanthionine synthetase C family protein [Chitinophaga sp.]|uniref:lanthionine synthetase C family protein n=1 Tax=Chitinophaga sp. TaxID=1869181 RepID=UPI002C700746|nr:lanthionine synthetase C family protein [Chitinophaga sp.]HVI43862.1 lanthionine synthetase C family protein [Chitinophaga sp.]